MTTLKILPENLQSVTAQYTITDLYASLGVIPVTTDIGYWVVPLIRAVWIPAQTRYQISLQPFGMTDLVYRSVFFPWPILCLLCNFCILPVKRTHTFSHRYQ